MKQVFGILRDLLLPRLCAACDSRLGTGENVLCVNCLRQFPRTFYWRQPFDNEMARLLWGRVPLERCAALFFYQPETPLARAIHSLKYNRKREIGIMLGRLVAEEMQSYGFFDGIDAIVPLPTTKGREAEHGYNQTEIIGVGISEVVPLPVWTDVVERVLFRKSQTRVAPSERRKNVENVFSLVDGQRLKDKHILIVDDILTKGETVSSCSSVMNGIEGLRISVATIGFTKQGHPLKESE